MLRTVFLCHCGIEMFKHKEIDYSSRSSFISLSICSYDRVRIRRTNACKRALADCDIPAVGKLWSTSDAH